MFLHYDDVRFGGVDRSVSLDLFLPQYDSLTFMSCFYWLWYQRTLTYYYYYYYYYYLTQQVLYQSLRH